MVGADTWVDLEDIVVTRVLPQRGPRVVVNEVDPPSVGKMHLQSRGQKAKIGIGRRGRDRQFC